MYWETEGDSRVCINCQNKRGQIYSVDEHIAVHPPLHINCRCMIDIVEAVLAGTATNNGELGADYYISYHGHLPDYYITKEEAENIYWWKACKK